MQRVWLILFSACAALLAPLSARAASGAQEVDAAWAKAVKAGDLDGIVACYAPDAVLWLPGAPEARGTQAIRDAYEKLLSNNTVAEIAMSKAVYETVKDLSAGWGNFALTMHPKGGGEPVVLRGRFTEVAKKIKGRWLYVADQASLDPPPAAGANP